MLGAQPEGIREAAESVGTAGTTVISLLEKLGGLPYLNSETDRNETWGNVPRDNDASRVQYSDLTKIEWGRNPMYSELDDHGDSWKTYVPPGRRYTGLEGTGTLSRFGEGLVDWEYVLKDAGILSDNPEEDPDYVAGRFDSVEQYNTYLDPDAKLEPVEEETDEQEAADPPVYRYDGWDQAVAFSVGTYGGFPMEYMGPDGTYIGDEAAAAMHKAARRAEREARAAERDRKHAEDEAARTVQTVPDAHPGATHIHDTPWVPPDVPYLPHYLPDPHIPQQLPLDQIAAEIAEGHTGSGVKVI